MSYLYSIMAAAGGWRLYLGDDELVDVFADLKQAERRARFLAARAAVRGFDSEILVYGRDGLLHGCWRAESFEPAAARCAA